MILDDLKELRSIVFEQEIRKPSVIIPQTIESVLEVYNLDDATYRRISSLMLHEMEKGLNKSTNYTAKVKMYPAYVRDIINGSECGDFLALDLGGTNFRVLSIKLKGGTMEMKNKIFPIAPEIMTGPGTALFDHIADCIEVFMTSEGLLNKKLSLGFTFSFPLKQEGLNVGRLANWTKGFNCSGVESEDVVQLLHDALRKKAGLDVECVAVLNDTVGCLMSCAFLDHRTEIGVVIGTGTNACYMEQLERVGTWDGDSEDPKQVILNTEWGAFGDNGCLDFIRTSADKRIDVTSLNPRKQIFEKMISGMYMGEIARQVIVQCAHHGLLFGGEVPKELATRGKFFTKYVSEIEADDDEEEGFPQIKLVLDELGLDTVSNDDCKAVKHICGVISRRAAFLAAAGIATLINRINKPNVTVAVDGSLYRFHPHFQHLMRQKIGHLVNPGLRFSLMLAEDGSGKGAALVAAVSDRLKAVQK